MATALSDTQHSAPAPGRLIARAVAQVVVSTVALLVLYAAMPLDRAHGAARIGWLAAGMAAFVAVAGLQIRAILRARYPALRAITGFGVVIPLFIVVFASTYLSLATNDPRAFSEALSHVDALYFTVTVFSTVGFGDITPRSEAARIAVTVQMIGGLLVLGLLARVVVAAVQEKRHRLRTASRRD